MVAAKRRIPKEFKGWTREQFDKLVETCGGVRHAIEEKRAFDEGCVAAALDGFEEVCGSAVIEAILDRGEADTLRMIKLLFADRRNLTAGGLKS